MKKNYFSCWSIGSLAINLFITFLCWTLTYFTAKSVLEIVNPNSDIYHFVSFWEAFMGGIIALIICVITAVFGGIHFGELIRRIHINWINRH